MNIQLCKSKIHRARITLCDVNYEGSLGIDINFLNEVGIMPYEKILVVNAINGERLETYAIPLNAGSKEFCLNGAAAHKGNKGDIITIMSFGSMSEEDAKTFIPKIIVLDENNNITTRKGALK